MTISQLDYQLSGRHVFITGGATGIGAALVTAFVEQQANVTFVDINGEAGESLMKRLSPKSTQAVKFARLDVTDTKALQQMIAGLGQLDVLINNVGNDARFNSETITEAQWLNCMNINLHPAFFACQAAIPMLKGRGGVILNFCSNMAYLGERDMAAYVTAKAGIAGMTKALARDFGSHNIRVNAIVPGWVATERQLEQWLSPRQESQLMEMVSIPKRITPEEIAKLALFLASDDSGFITGQCMVIDGGRL